MKKTLFTISIMAGLMMTACVKETANEQMGLPEGAMLLTTENFTGHGSKTSVSGTTVQWVSGDNVDFWNSSSKQTRTVTVNEGKAYIATALDASSNAIYGYYPSGIAYNNQNKDNVGINIPAQYECSVDASGRQVIALPMVAKASSGANVIEFKHVTAAVNVMLKNSMGTALNVDSVIVLSDTYRLNFTPGYNYKGLDLSSDNMGIAAVSTSNSGQRKVKVYFPTPLEVPTGSSNKSIQVPFYPIGADNLTIYVYCHTATSTYCYNYKQATGALGRNELVTAKVDLNTEGNMTAWNEVYLSDKSSNFTAADGDALIGKPGATVTCTIPNNAKISLHNVVGTSTSKYLYLYAEGDATVVLSGSNAMKGAQALIRVNPGNTITIQGSGSLEASTTTGAVIGSYGSNPCGNIVIKSGTIRITGSGSGSAAIGCHATTDCGNITIEGGNITVAGGTSAAGIGAGNGAGQCGDISITGGTIVATGGSGAAGIGTGGNASSQCGDITIAATVTSVTATKGTGATASIGKGNASSTCGTVSIADPSKVTEN